MDPEPGLTRRQKMNRKHRANAPGRRPLPKKKMIDVSPPQKAAAAIPRRAPAPASASSEPQTSRSLLGEFSGFFPGDDKDRLK